MINYSHVRWLVVPGERRALFSASAAYFFLLAGYYILRSLREAFALQVGRSNIASLFYASFIVMLGVLPLYWFVVARLPRRWLFPVIYSAVVIFFSGLAFGIAENPLDRSLAAIYFVAVTSLNLFIVSVFWSVMVDAWRSDSAKRLFGFIAAGGSAGAIAGPLFNALFIQRIGPSSTILVACVLIMLSVFLGRHAQSLEPDKENEKKHTLSRLSMPVGGTAIDDLKRLITSRYLLAIALIVIAGQLLAGFMYQEQAKYVESAYITLVDRAALFARIDFLVSVLSLFFQLFLVGFLVTRGGLQIALGLVPLLLVGSLILLALIPLGMVLLGTQIFRRAVDYGLFKPTREMLFTILNPESKFKSKSLIDTLLQRGGDSLSQAIYPFVAGLGLAGVAWACVVVSLSMLSLALWLGRFFSIRENRSFDATNVDI